MQNLGEQMMRVNNITCPQKWVHTTLAAWGESGFQMYYDFLPNYFLNHIKQKLKRYNNTIAMESSDLLYCHTDR